jgi:DNA-directed RNA polymerase subunit RPC12/RpoP
MPCGRCGAQTRRFYTLSDAEKPNLCPQCFRALLKMIDTLALAEPARSDPWLHRQQRSISSQRQ